MAFTCRCGHTLQLAAQCTQPPRLGTTHPPNLAHHAPQPPTSPASAAPDSTIARGPLFGSTVSSSSGAGKDLGQGGPGCASPFSDSRSSTDEEQEGAGGFGQQKKEGGPCGGASQQPGTTEVASPISSRACWAGGEDVRSKEGGSERGADKDSGDSTGDDAIPAAAAATRARAAAAGRRERGEGGPLRRLWLAATDRGAEMPAVRWARGAVRPASLGGGGGAGNGSGAAAVLKGGGGAGDGSGAAAVLKGGGGGAGADNKREPAPQRKQQISAPQASKRRAEAGAAARRFRKSLRARLGELLAPCLRPSCDEF
jgi:hypothetical protein